MMGLQWHHDIPTGQQVVGLIQVTEQVFDDSRSGNRPAGAPYVRSISASFGRADFIPHPSGDLIGMFYVLTTGQSMVT